MSDESPEKSEPPSKQQVDEEDEEAEDDDESPDQSEENVAEEETADDKPEEIDAEKAETDEPVASTSHPLDSYDDAQLVATIERLQADMKYSQIENLVYYNFLAKNDPAALEGMNKVIQGAILVQEQTNRRRMSLVSSKSMGRLSTASSIGSNADKALRINLTEKMELVLLEMEETQVCLERFMRKSHRTKCNLSAQLEEIALREAETTEAMNIFEKSIIIEGVDELTQKIPIEKFVRYMKEWLKSSQHTINKIRLRISSMKTQYQKLNHLLTQKQLQGESIQKVDFEQLQIENSHLKEKINQKTVLLLEMKQISGTANLALSIHKKKLLKQLEEMKILKEQISSKESGIVMLDEESEKISVELDNQRIKYDNIRKMLEVYEVPDVMEYIKTKRELHVLKKNVKIWSRRKQLKDMALISCLREMKHVTGSKAIRPSWFDELQASDSSLLSTNDEELLSLPEAMESEIPEN